MSDGKKLLHAILSAVIASGGAFFAVAADLPTDQDVGDVRTITWLVVLGTGVVAAAKDLQTFVSGKKVGIQAAKRQPAVTS